MTAIRVPEKPAPDRRIARMRFPRGLGAKAAYLLWLTPSVVVGWILFLASVTAGLGIAVAGLGILVLPVMLAGVRYWTDLHRRVAGSVLGKEIPARRRVLEGGQLRRFGRMLGDRTTWRDLGWLVVNAIVGTPIAAVSLIIVLGPFVTLFAMFFWWIRPADDPLHLQLGTPLTDWGTALGLGTVNLVLAVVAAIVLVPLLAGAHANLSRLLLGRSTVERLESASTCSPAPAAAPSTPTAPNSAASNATSTTAPRPASSPSPCASASRAAPSPTTRRSSNASSPTPTRAPRPP